MNLLSMDQLPIRRYSAAPFNHCSTICPYRDGVLIAWYAGIAECRDDQSVRLIFIDNEAAEAECEQMRLGPGTGNPVLFQTATGPVLLYSQFETPERLSVERWKYCTLWLQRLEVANGHVTLLGPRRLLANQHAHLLGRCAPLAERGRLLLPLYDELARRPLVLEGDGWNFRPLTHFGMPGMIQPTLWRAGNRIYALCRNIGIRHNAMVCSSVDGYRWTDPVMTAIPNANNSLAALADWKGKDWLVWNNCHAGRYKLTLGTVEPRDGQFGRADTVIANTRQVLEIQHGSYPSICTDSEGRLHIVYTDPQFAITHRRFC